MPDGEHARNWLVPMVGQLAELMRATGSIQAGGRDLPASLVILISSFGARRGEAPFSLLWSVLSASSGTRVSPTMSPSSCFRTVRPIPVRAMGADTGPCCRLQPFPGTGGDRLPNHRSCVSRRVVGSRLADLSAITIKEESAQSGPAWHERGWRRADRAYCMRSSSRLVQRDRRIAAMTLPVRQEDRSS